VIHWESKLLEVYLGSLQLIDARDRGQAILPRQVSKFFLRGVVNTIFQNFRNPISREPYIKCRNNMEVNSWIYGAKSRRVGRMEIQWKSGKQKSLPFFAKLFTQLMADHWTGFDQANEVLNKLKDSGLSDPIMPIISFTEAILFLKRGKLNSSRKN